MSVYTKEFIQSQYTLVSLLSETSRTKVEVVRRQAGPLAIRKTLHYQNSVYTVLKKLYHPGLVHIFELMISNNETVIIEEYIGGETIQQKIDRGDTFTLGQVYNWLCQLAQILIYIHSNNIIHRDIKPANLIISSDGVLKLIDFDSSRTYRETRQTDTTYLGTKGYASPEQYGYAQTDARSDIYSAGILCNQLLTGQLTGGTIYDAKFRRIVSICTQLDPQYRYQSAIQLLDALKAPSTADNNSKQAAAYPRLTERLRADFAPNRFWRFIIWALIILLFSAAAFTDKTYDPCSPVLIWFSYIWTIGPPVMYLFDNFLVRSAPILPGFIEKRRPILYCILYLLLWFIILLILVIFIMEIANI